MKYLIIAILITLSLNAASQNLKALDEKMGFREMKFGDSISKFDDLVGVEYSNDSSSIYYIRTNDKLTIGSTEVSLTYGFYKNKFYSVFIKTKGYSNSKSILKTLIEMYGKGYQSNRYIDDFSWYGKKVSLSYDENSISGDAQVLMYSKIIMNEITTDEKEKAKKAKDDF